MDQLFGAVGALMGAAAVALMTAYANRRFGLGQARDELIAYRDRQIADLTQQLTDCEAEGRSKDRVITRLTANGK